MKSEGVQSAAQRGGGMRGIVGVGVCVCVCVREREREREEDRTLVGRSVRKLNHTEEMERRWIPRSDTKHTNSPHAMITCPHF